jgi:hypothetical protein
MKITSKIVSTLLAAFLASNWSIQQAASQSTQTSQCPNPFPESYKSPKTKKDVKIADLGIVVRVSTDQRLVYIKNEQRFTFMTPPEYKSYRCSLAKKVDYTSFYPYLHQLTYRIIKNPNRQPLAKILKDFYKDTIFIDKLGQAKLNGIEFLTTPIDQGDPTTGWFIPKARPDIVVEYTVFCDCGGEYKDLIDDLSNIKNIVN